MDDYVMHLSKKREVQKLEEGAVCLSNPKWKINLDSIISNIHLLNDNANTKKQIQ